MRFPGNGGQIAPTADLHYPPAPILLGFPSARSRTRKTWEPLQVQERKTNLAQCPYKGKAIEAKEEPRGVQKRYWPSVKIQNITNCVWRYNIRVRPDKRRVKFRLKRKRKMWVQIGVPKIMGAVSFNDNVWEKLRKSKWTIVVQYSAKRWRQKRPRSVLCTFVDCFSADSA